MLHLDKFLSASCCSIPRAKAWSSSEDTSKDFTPESVIQKLDEDIIGSESGFWGPFGWRKYTYVDHTASGKAVKSVEKFIEKEVLPHYANTHTTLSNTSLQTTVLRDEARKIIRQSVGATDEDEVIFCGAGATAAVHKLLHCVSYPESKKLIVFVGPFEHHSNILPWREAASKVIQMPLNLMTGQVDLDFLRRHLKKVTSGWNDKNQLVVGCFSAGSNITGVVSDDVEITELLHEYGALAFWDYAAAAPHVEINMNPCKKLAFYYNNNNVKSHLSAAKDAIFFSGHKFLGGPQTPGVLVLKKNIVHNPIPHDMGGGTVLFTTRKRHQYLKEIHEREEGGTPNIVGSIRLGLVFRLRNCVGIQTIISREREFCRRFVQAMREVAEIHILGSSPTHRLPIVSFMIEHVKTGFFLHHNFVVALLNDLFGIQCRGGCMCAGPYAQVLLGIDDKLASVYEAQLKTSESKDGNLLKPGFVRISFNFHSSDEEVNFIIDAVKLVARFGWRLLPHYRIDSETASFISTVNHVEDVVVQTQKSRLTTLSSFDNLLLSKETHSYSLKKNKNLWKDDFREAFDYNECLRQVQDLIRECEFEDFSQLQKFSVHFDWMNSNPRKEQEIRKFRWFMVPHESALLQCPEYEYIHQRIKCCRPFSPINFTGTYLREEGNTPNELSSIWNLPGLLSSNFR